MSKHSYEVVILDKENIDNLKNYLRSCSLKYSEDFLLDYVVFITVNTKVRDKLLKNKNFKLNQNFAYLM